jgi:hypothetical protein
MVQGDGVDDGCHWNDRNDGNDGVMELSTMWWNVLQRRVRHGIQWNRWDGVGDGSTDFWV